MSFSYLIVMGPQFAHIQTFPRKENPAGQSVDQVLGEAIRDAEYSPHVENPGPPAVLYGVDLDELRQLHDQIIEGAATEVKTKKIIRRRSIRVDRHTLMTVVASYPLTYEQTFAALRGMSKLGSNLPCAAPAYFPIITQTVWKLAFSRRKIEIQIGHLYFGPVSPFERSELRTMAFMRAYEAV